MISEHALSGAGTVGVRGRRAALMAASVLAILAAATVAQAQNVGPAPANNGGDDSLTWKGITLYGTVDIGLQYQSHGAPISDYFPAGSEDVIQKNASHSVLGATPSNLSQSRVGLSGAEPLPGVGDWTGVFK